MRVNIFITATIFIFTSELSIAQQNGDIQIHSDPRIEQLIKKQGNKSSGALPSQMMGYRVQLLFEPDRKTIEDARNKFNAAHPNIDAYVIFNAPHFFLKVGDFRTQLEAEKLKDLVISDFPASFIIKEQVNLPKIENE